MSVSALPWPTELRVAADRCSLAIDYDNGETFDLPAEYLRVESPSAEVKGHGRTEKLLVSGKAAVRIEKADPVGSYAVRLTFDDGHDTGFYTWEYLHKLGQEQDRLWAAYLARLEAAGASRAGAA